MKIEYDDEFSLIHLTVCIIRTFTRNRLGAEHNSHAVAVGTPVARRPPHRSVRAALPHTALTSGGWRRSLLLLAHEVERSTRRAGSESGTRPSMPCSPWSIPFPPRTPPPPAGRLCSPASLVLWDRPTPCERACRACGQRPSPTVPSPSPAGAGRVSRFPCIEFPRMLRVSDSAASAGGLR